LVDRHPFVWRRRVSLIIAIAIGLVVGCSFPGDRSVTQNLVIPILPVPQHNPDLNSAKNTDLMVVEEEPEKFLVALAEAEKVKFLNLPLPLQFQGKIIRQIKLNTQDKAIAQGEPLKAIALTFDDGPWPEITSQVLDILKGNNVKATFFVVGKQVQKYPQLLKQVVAEGHAIGNHTWSHQYGPYNESTAAREIEDTATLIYQTTGVKTSLFRPPAGILNNGLVTYAQQQNYGVVMWSVDSKDWRSRPTRTPAFIDNVLKEAKPGGIVLLHDGGGDRSATIKALPQLIAQLKKRGYQFVTVPELLEMGDKL